MYFISHFHDYEKIFGAYFFDKSNDKVLLLEKSLKKVFIDSNMIDSKVKTYHIRKFYVNFIFLYVKNFRKIPVNLYVNSLMGNQIIYAFSFFKIKNVFFTNKAINLEISQVFNYTPVEFALKLVFKCFTGESLVKYKYRSYCALGLANGKLSNQDLVQYLPIREHNYDAIMLDIGSHLGINLKTSAQNVSRFLSTLGNVAIKKHPSFDWGIGKHLDFDKIEDAIPVETLANDNVILVFLLSSAAKSFNKKINVINLLEFNSESSKSAIITRVHRELNELNTLHMYLPEK